MKLKTSANAAREHIVEMINAGNILLEKVTGEYYAGKRAGTFDEKKDIPRWKDQQIDWLHKCLSGLQDVFPTPTEAIRLKNTQASAAFQSDQNIKWSGLTNEIRSKLSALDRIDKSIEKYSLEMGEELFIEDIDSFAKARDINPRQVKRLLPPETFGGSNTNLRLGDPRRGFPSTRLQGRSERSPHGACQSRRRPDESGFLAEEKWNTRETDHQQMWEERSLDRKACSGIGRSLHHPARGWN